MIQRNPNRKTRIFLDRVYEPDYQKSLRVSIGCQLCDKEASTGNPSCDPFDEEWVLGEILLVHKWQRVDVAGKDGLIRVWRCPDHHIELPEITRYDED